MPDIFSISKDFKQFVLSDADASMGLGDTSHLDILSDPSLNHLYATTAKAKTLLANIESCHVEDFD